MTKKRGFVSVQGPTQAELEEASSPETSPERFFALAERRQRKIALRIAQNPNAPSALLEKLASPGEAILRATNPPALGHTPWTNPEMFRWEVNKAIRQAIASNPSTPPKTLLTLASHFPKEVSQNPALSLAFLEDASVLYQLEPAVLLLLVSTKEFSHLAEQVARHPELRVRILLARDRRTPKALLEKLAADPSEEVRTSATRIQQFMRKGNKPIPLP